MKRIIFPLFVSCTGVLADEKTPESVLKNRTKDKSPKEIGLRISDKFLNTPHSQCGNTHTEPQPERDGWL